MIRTPLQRIEQAIIVSVLLLLVVITLQPILNLLAISLSDPTAVTEMSGLEIFPKRPSTGVWGILINHPAVQRGLWNSFVITGIATVLNVVVTAMMAWALSRPSLPGRRFLFVLV